MASKSIVGDVINFRGLVYGPVNEMGVVALFAKISEELGFIIEEVKAGFPDCVARRVTLTEGGFKNGYIIIRPIDDFWPEECIGENVKLAEKRLIVEFHGVGRITTDISGRYKSLRAAHGATKEFFQKHQLQPGDEVEIVRLSRYEYRIRPVK